MPNKENPPAATGALSRGGAHAAGQGQPTTFRDRAMEHLRRGTPVFPVNRNKKPFEAGGFHTASTDPARIAHRNDPIGTS